MSAVVTWFGGAMVASLVLMLVVLVIRPAVARVFGPTVAYALWLLPALRMLLPSLPGDWIPGRAALAFAPPQMAALTSVVPPTPVGAGPDWTLTLFVIWAAGVIGFFAWQLITHHVFMARSLAGSASLTRAAGIEVLQGPAIAGPMASGVLRRRILLPADFTERFTPEERRLALAHETAHHCRGDLIANLAGLALLSLHWFNPFAHLAYRAFRDDQEAACDATVLGAESRESRHAYGLAILKSASCRVPGAACALNHAGAMKRRILIMIDGRKSRALRFAGATLAAVLVGLGLVATASTFAAPAIAPAHHMTFIEGKGDNLTITRDGHTRRATPTERRQIEHDIAQAEAARRIAERQAGQAERNLAAMLGDMPEQPASPAAPPLPPVPPMPPMPPVPGVSPVPPTPPVPPVPPRGEHQIAMAGHGDYSVDRKAIQAEVSAAMESARQAVAEARVQMASARDEMLSSAQVRRMALDEARADREDALNTVAQARRDAAQARRDAAQAVRDAAQVARDARRDRGDSI